MFDINRRDWNKSSFFFGYSKSFIELVIGAPYAKPLKDWFDTHPNKIMTDEIANQIFNSMPQKDVDSLKHFMIMLRDLKADRIRKQFKK